MSPTYVSFLLVIYFTFHSQVQAKSIEVKATAEVAPDEVEVSSPKTAEAKAIGAVPSKLVRRERHKPMKDQDQPAGTFDGLAVVLLRLLALVIPLAVMAALLVTGKFGKEEQFEGCTEAPPMEDLGLEPVSAVAAALAKTAASGVRSARSESLLLHGLFQEVVNQRPDAPAVLSPWGKQVLATFADLEVASNQLARWLRREGLKQAAPVAVALAKALSNADATAPRPCEMHQAALLAILKCGSPYVPIDARDWPPARQRFVLDDCKASLVLADAPLKAPPAQEAKIKQAFKVLLLSDLPSEISGGPLTESGFGAKETGLCHVLYTSGSTGRPKAVLTSHRAAASRCNWMRSELPFAADEVVITRTSLCFVDHVWETFGPLGAGTAVCDFAPLGRSQVSRLASALEACNVTRLVIMPSLGRRLLDYCEDQLPASLRQVTFSGEVLTVALLRRTILALPNATGASVLNLYGCTEVAGDVTWQIWLKDSIAVKAWLADASMQDPALAAAAGVAPRGQAVPDLHWSTMAPLGRSIPGSEVYVCNPATLLPVATGQVGEFIVTGVQLANGYGRRDRKTGKFLHLRIPRRGNMPAFRTGDFGFQDEDGIFWYCGREDDMMKIRGERIDLQEVQTAVELVLDCGFGGHEDALEAPIAPALAARQALLEAVPSITELAVEVAVMAYEGESSDSRLAVLIAVPPDVIPPKLGSAALRVESAVRAALHGMLPLSAVPWRIIFFPAAMPKTAISTTMKGEVLFPRLSTGKIDKEKLKIFLEANVSHEAGTRDGPVAGCLPWTWSSEVHSKESCPTSDKVPKKNGKDSTRGKSKMKIQLV